MAKLTIDLTDPASVAAAKEIVDWYHSRLGGTDAKAYAAASMPITEPDAEPIGPDIEKTTDEIPPEIDMADLRKRAKTLILAARETRKGFKPAQWLKDQFNVAKITDVPDDRVHEIISEFKNG